MKGMNQGSIWGQFMEKIRGRKSRANVPLMSLQMSKYYCTIFDRNSST
jgi:hypothetical protein